MCPAPSVAAISSPSLFMIWLQIETSIPYHTIPYHTIRPEMESSHAHLQLTAPPFTSPSITVLAMASRLCLLISIAGSLFLLSGYVCLFPVSAASPFFLRAHSPSSFGPNGNPNYLTQEPKWMSQRIDHFTPQVTYWGSLPLKSIFNIFLEIHSLTCMSNISKYRHV